MLTSYILKRAMIESTRKIFIKKEPGSNFLCRVLPDMVGLEPLDQLPRYPSFLANDSRSYSAGDVVWVVCTTDFQIGYILGLAETPIGTENTAIFTQINATEEAAKLPKSKPEDISFAQRQPGILDFYNKGNKQSGRIYATGVIFLYGADGSFHTKQLNSYVKVTASGEISITGKMLNESVETSTLEVQNVYKEDLGSKEVSVLGTVKEEISGGHSSSIVGDDTNYVVGNVSQTVIGTATEVNAGGHDETIILGNHTEKILAGNYSLLIAAGNISLATALGTVNIGASGAINLAAPLITLTAGMTKITGPLTLPVGVVVPSYLPGLNCLPLCPLTGLPHGGQVLLGL